LFSDLSLFFSVWADLLVSFSFLTSSVSGGGRLLILGMAAAAGRWKGAAGMERDGACGWSVGSTPPLLSLGRPKKEMLPLGCLLEREQPRRY